MSARTLFAKLLLVLLVGLSTSIPGAQAINDPLPSWNDRPAKHAIINFVHQTTTPGSPGFVLPEARIATFDQDGTLWVEHPIYTELVFAFDRVVALAPQHPEWRTTEPFRSVIAGDKATMAKFTIQDLEKIVVATHTGMTVEAFQAIVRDWLKIAKHPRWNRPYTELIYQPMLEVMQYLRANGYRTYIVTGGGQDFVRAYSEQVYGVRLEEVIGTALSTQYSYDKNGRAILMLSPNLLLYNDLSGKPEDIYLFTGRHPQAAFGNTAGDQQMLEYTQAGGGVRLMMLVLHDDPLREYAYGPAAGLPNTNIGAFSPALLTEANQRGWIVISMKNDWNRIFPFER